MKTLLTILILAQTGGGTWHDRFIEDNCNRCPECCVDEKDCVEAQPLAIDAKAPCSGILWPVGYTADALEAMKVTLPACQVKLQAKTGELSVCDATIIKVKDECDKTMNRFAQITKKAARIERPWWDNNPFWGGVGFVSGVIVAVLIVSSAR
jgi:hypothetical protein